MQIHELAYDAAVKFLETLPKDCAEYKAFKTMQASHGYWKRTAIDLFALGDKMQERLNNTSLVPTISKIM